MIPKKAKKTKSKNTGISLVTGLLVGGAVGSVVSLMFAPDKGEKTRKKALKQGKKILKDSSSKAEDFINKYKQKINETTRNK